MPKAKTLSFAILAIAGWWCGNKVSWQVRADSAAEKDISSILDGMWRDIIERPGHISFTMVDILAGLGVAAILGLIWAYHAGARRASRPGEEQGSARWGKQREIRPFIGDRNNDLLFTKTESLNLDSRVTQRNLNVLTIGSSGSGKSRYFVMPNLFQCNTSYVVTDPKGEVLSATGSHLRSHGYEIRCLNLIDFAKSDTFNPLAYFNEEQAEVDCAILTENFITNTTGQKPTGGGLDFWEKAERALLMAFISYVYFTKRHQGTLLDVVDLLASMSASEENEQAISEVDALFASIQEHIAAYDSDPQSYDPEATAMLEGLRFAAAQYNVYTQGAGETKKSIIISLGVRMAPLHMAPVRRILSSNTVEADKVGARPTALFLIIPDTHQAFSFLASIFYETFFERNLYLADHNGGRLNVPVQCFMDEFANIGKMPSFERKIAVMRSRGISTSVILQNYSQGKALYRDDWETIVGNCDSLLFLGGNEPSTTEFISKRLGKETITSEDTSQQRGSSGSWSQSWRSQGRELLTPDEIARLRGHECIYLLRGLPPYRSRKLDAPKTGKFVYSPRALRPQLGFGDSIDNSNLNHSEGQSVPEYSAPGADMDDSNGSNGWLSVVPASDTGGVFDDSQGAYNSDEIFDITMLWPDGRREECMILADELEGTQEQQFPQS